MTIQKNTWLWEATDLQNAARVDKLLKFCRNNRVDTIYVQLSTAVLDADYRSFIGMASGVGIRVHAAVGDSSWYDPTNYNKVQAVLDRLVTYQAAATPSQIFTGIHFDIEPHTTNEFKDLATRAAAVDKWKQVVINYNGFIDATLGIEVSAALPISVSSIDDNTGIMISEFMMQRHDKIVIMSYRDFDAGQDSITYHVDKFMNQAVAMGMKEKVLFGVETKPGLIPAKQSFAEEGLTAMNLVIEKVELWYKDNISYGGYGIHALKYWVDMV